MAVSSPQKTQRGEKRKNMEGINFRKLEKETGIKMRRWEKEMIWYLRSDGTGCIRPVVESGSGRYAQYLDHTAEIKDALDNLGFKYRCSNDAPRGGRLGDLIEFRARKNGKVYKAIMKEGE
jgi:hypothetical protein